MTAIIVTLLAYSVILTVGEFVRQGGISQRTSDIIGVVLAGPVCWLTLLVGVIIRPFSKK